MIHKRVPFIYTAQLFLVHRICASTEETNQHKPQQEPRHFPQMTPIGRTWRQPTVPENSLKRKPFMAKEFNSTRFDTFISSVGNVDPGSGGMRLYSEHLSNIERLHYSYFLACTVLSALFFVPILYWLFGTHEYKETLSSIVSEYFFASSSRFSDIARKVGTLHEFLGEYVAWRIFEYTTVLFIWLCITDRLRYVLFVRVVGKLWHRKKWLEKPIQSTWLKRVLHVYTILRGKRKDRHVGLM